MMDEEEAGGGFILSPASPLLPLLQVEDKSVWALCRNTSLFRKDENKKNTFLVWYLFFKCSTVNILRVLTEV